MKRFVVMALKFGVRWVDARLWDREVVSLYRDAWVVWDRRAVHVRVLSRNDDDHFVEVVIAAGTVVHGIRFDRATTRKIDVNAVCFVREEAEARALWERHHATNAKEPISW